MSVWRPLATAFIRGVRTIRNRINIGDKILFNCVSADDTFCSGTFFSRVLFASWNFGRDLINVIVVMTWVI